MSWSAGCSWRPGIAAVDKDLCPRRCIRLRSHRAVPFFTIIDDFLLLLLNSTKALMESVVPPQITTELTQILSNLVLGDNEIRAK